MLGTSTRGHTLERELAILLENSPVPVFTSLRKNRQNLQSQMYELIFSQHTFLHCHGKTGLVYRESLSKHKTSCQSKKASVKWGLTKGFMITWRASSILKMLSEEGMPEDGEKGTEEEEARIIQEAVQSLSGKTTPRCRNEWCRIMEKAKESQKKKQPNLKKGRWLSGRNKGSVLQSDPRGEAGLRDNSVGQGSASRTKHEKEIATAAFKTNRNREWTFDWLCVWKCLKQFRVGRRQLVDRIIWGVYMANRRNYTE